jgi:hypothetical protein
VYSAIATKIIGLGQPLMNLCFKRNNVHKKVHAHLKKDGKKPCKKKIENVSLIHTDELRYGIKCRTNGRGAADP